MLERMVFYGQTGHCRWRVLLENFDEAERLSSCGSCDNCGRIAAAFAAAEAERDAGKDERPEPDHAAAPAFARGEPVSVRRYGRGLVDACDAEGVTVVFAGGERRTFLPAFVHRDSGPSRQQKLPQAVPAHG
jgi:ATP-dependent DNA helicase RecQ